MGKWKFTDERIRRGDIPVDVHTLLHDLAYHHDNRDVQDYVRRAQQALISKGGLPKSSTDCKCGHPAIWHRLKRDGTMGGCTMCVGCKVFRDWRVPNPRKPGKPRPVQPDWLIKQTDGLEKGYLWEVFIDGRDFAVVRSPGHKYYADRLHGSKYGKVSYHLTDKRIVGQTAAYSKGIELQDGGHALKPQKEKWKRMVEMSDESGEFVIL